MAPGSAARRTAQSDPLQEAPGRQRPAGTPLKHKRAASAAAALHRGLVDFQRSLLGHEDRFAEVEAALAKGENVVLLANHQTEVGPSAAAAWSRVRASLRLGIRGGCGACHGYVRPVHRPHGGRWPPPRPTPAPLQNARPLLTPAGRPRCVCAAAGGALPAAGDRRGLRGGGPRGDRRAVRSLLHGPQPLLRAQQGEPGAWAQAAEQPPLPALMMAAALRMDLPAPPTILTALPIPSALVVVVAPKLSPLRRRSNLPC